MPYYSEEQLQALGFKSLGRNVKVSTLASIYNHDQIEIGDNSRIDDFCVISGRVRIGKYVHIAPYCLLAGGEPGIFMDDFSGLAYSVKVFAQSDDYSGRTMTNPTVPKKYKNEAKKAIEIGRHVIIGAGSMVVPGNVLGEGCAVGAMSLVRHSLEPWTLCVGNPATKIKDRKKDLIELERQLLAEKM